AAIARPAIGAKLHRQAARIVDRGDAVTAAQPGAFARSQAEAVATHARAVEEAHFAARRGRGGTDNGRPRRRYAIAHADAEARAAGHGKAEGNAGLAGIDRLAAGAEIVGRDPAIGAALDDVAPGALAALHVDLFAAAQRVDDGVAGAGAGAHIHIAG